jgi:hypothetical protein
MNPKKKRRNLKKRKRKRRKRNLKKKSNLKKTMEVMVQLPLLPCLIMKNLNQN